MVCYPGLPAEPVPLYSRYAKRVPYLFQSTEGIVRILDLCAVGVFDLCYIAIDVSLDGSSVAVHVCLCDYVIIAVVFIALCISKSICYSKDVTGLVGLTPNI